MFDVTRLRAFAELAGSKVTDFGGVPILSDPEKDSGSFALLDNIILAGSRDQVKAAIKRRGQKRVLNSQMANRVAAVSKQYDAWLVSIAPIATLAANLPADAKMEGLTSAEALRQIEQFSIGVSMRSDLTFGADLVMTTDEAASRMADGLQMIMAMAQQGAKDDASVAALKHVNFGIDQNVVHVGLNMPVDEVEKAVVSAMKLRMNPGPTTAAAAPLPAEPPVIQQAPERHQSVPVAKPAAGAVARSPRIPANAEIMIQSSPKDMGTVVILGSKK